MHNGMQKLFRRLRLRLTAACTLVTGLVLIGMALVSLAFSEAQLRERTNDEFRTSLDAVTLYLRSAVFIDPAWLAQTEASGSLTIYLQDAGKPLLYGNERDPLPVAQAVETAWEQYGFDILKPPETLLSQSVVFPMQYDMDMLAAVGTVPLSGGGWLGFVIYKPVPQILRLRLLFAGSTALALVCLFVFAWYFTARAIRPVEESRRRQLDFVSAASHELRSPLAVMRASADAMQNAPPEQMERFARTISGECARLSRLTGDLLLLAGADNSRWTLEPTIQEPETLLLAACESFEPVAAGKRISLRVLLPEAPLPRVCCDGQRIAQLLAILLDNALSYTPKGGHVTLRAEADERAVRLSVADDGPGIPDADKARIFERFYRADPSRSQREHFGLGLAIAREIAALHRGTLRVSDTPGGGAVFSLTLPAAKEKSLL